MSHCSSRNALYDWGIRYTLRAYPKATTTMARIKAGLAIANWLKPAERITTSSRSEINLLYVKTTTVNRAIGMIIERKLGTSNMIR